MKIKPNVAKDADGLENVDDFWDEGGTIQEEPAAAPPSPPVQANSPPDPVQTPLSTAQPSQTPDKPPNATPNTADQPSTANRTALESPSDDDTPFTTNVSEVDYDVGGDDNRDDEEDVNAAEENKRREPDTDPEGARPADGSPPRQKKLSFGSPGETKAAAARKRGLSKGSQQDDDEAGGVAAFDPSSDDEDANAKPKTKAGKVVKKSPVVKQAAKRPRKSTQGSNDEDSDGSSGDDFAEYYRRKQGELEATTPGGAILSPEYDMRRLRKSIKKGTSEPEEGVCSCHSHSPGRCLVVFTRLPCASQRKRVRLVVPIDADGLLYSTGKVNVYCTLKKARSEQRLWAS